MEIETPDFSNSKELAKLLERIGMKPHAKKWIGGWESGALAAMRCFDQVSA